MAVGNPVGALLAALSCTDLLSKALYALQTLPDLVTQKALVQIVHIAWYNQAILLAIHTSASYARCTHFAVVSPLLLTRCTAASCLHMAKATI